MSTALPTVLPSTLKLNKAVVDRLGLIRDKPRSPGFHPSELHRMCPVFHYFVEQARAGLASDNPRPAFEFFVKVLEWKSRIFHPRLQLEFAVGDAIHQMVQYHLGAIGYLWGVWQCPICDATTKPGHMPRVMVEGVGGVQVADAAPCYGCHGVNRRNKQPWVYLEPRVRDEEWDVSGMCDGDLRVPRHALRAALEIKSINEYGWSEQKEPLPKPEHVTQASTYAAFMGVEWLYFIYVNKNQVSKWKEFLVPADPVALAEAKRKMAAANKGMAQGQPPLEARTCADPREKAARECPALSLCYPDHKPAASFWDASADSVAVLGGTP